MPATSLGRVPKIGGIARRKARKGRSAKRLRQLPLRKAHGHNIVIFGGISCAHLEYTAGGYLQMLAIPPRLLRSYEVFLEQSSVLAPHRPHYIRWLRFYLDFCHKYHHDPEHAASFGPFDQKLQAKNQERWKRQQASKAVALYHRMLGSAAGCCKPTMIFGSSSSSWGTVT